MRPARIQGLGLAALMVALAGSSWGGLPLPLWSCPIRQLTGVPCPTCYLTRSVLATLRGDLAGAVRLHAFGPPLVLLAAGLLWHQLMLGRAVDRRALAAWIVASSFLAWLYWLLRLAHPVMLP
jgi:hypothetical protein